LRPLIWAIALVGLSRSAFLWPRFDLSEDYTQVFLLGLGYYATGAWPYFGGRHRTSSEIWGALQSLLVGVPFHIAPGPEALTSRSTSRRWGACLFACTVRATA
jgi:hypothetical protein